LKDNFIDFYEVEFNCVIKSLDYTKNILFAHYRFPPKLLALDIVHLELNIIELEFVSITLPHSTHNPLFFYNIILF